MAQVRDMLAEKLSGLYETETQLLSALPEMATAANHPKLREVMEKHVVQTENQVDRLRLIFEMMGRSPEAKTCPAINGLIEEGRQIVEESKSKDPVAADLALIAAAQGVEHYEISCYGTARALARQLGEMPIANLLSMSLGEEESADFLLTSVADPLLQRAMFDELGGTVNLDEIPRIIPSVVAASQTGGDGRKRSVNRT
ncbi:hypothetical protein F183_A27850 [Bryobacterales bacterium F-183]|nr:hypothetical protein F183_A27850 [Bryobacterales bacterium F-183]